MEAPYGAGFPPASSISQGEPQIPPASRARKRGVEGSEEMDAAAKAASIGPAAIALTASATQQMEEVAHLFFSKVPWFCEDVCRRIGYPIDAANFHMEFIGNLVKSIHANRNLNVEKVLELARMMLGQSLNLADNAIRDLLQDQDLHQSCDALRARLLSMTVQDLNRQYDEAAECWIPGPLFSDVSNFCNAVEIALLKKFGNNWHMRFTSFQQRSTQDNTPSQ